MKHFYTNFAVSLTAVLAILKLMGAITISWLLVFTPLLALLGVVVIGLACIGLMILPAAKRAGKGLQEVLDAIDK